ncbi:putative transcription factor C3H family [Helianthus annuus]|nr:putative transcription factor C3H family [Helianthus annuus]
MDYGRESGNVVQIITSGSRNGGDYWGDQPVWATEDEYGVWDREASVDANSNSNYDGRQSQTRSGSEPPNKKRNGQGGDAQATSRSKAIGKMFFKTKLCCKFRAGGADAAGANPMLKPSNWKTRICNKWEQTGYCPFGSKCHFAHGAAELHRYGGGLVDIDAKDSPTSMDPNKQGLMTPKTPVEPVVAAGPTAAHLDGYHVGAPSRLPGVIPRTGQRPFQKWKGPDKISRIYGDWIDDIE